MKAKKDGRPQYLQGLWYYLPDYYSYCTGSLGIFIRIDKLEKHRKLSRQSSVGAKGVGPIIDHRQYSYADWVVMWWPIKKHLILPIDAPSPIPCDQELSEFLQTTIAAARLRKDIPLTSTETRKLKKLLKTRTGGEYVRS